MVCSFFYDETKNIKSKFLNENKNFNKYKFKLSSNNKFKTFLDDDGCPLVQCLTCGNDTPIPDHCQPLNSTVDDCDCGGSITRDKSGCPLLKCNECDDILRSGPKQFMVAHPVPFTIGVMITVVLTGLVFVCAVYMIFRRVKRNR